MGQSRSDVQRSRRKARVLINSVWRCGKKSGSFVDEDDAGRAYEAAIRKHCPDDQPQGWKRFNFSSADGEGGSADGGDDAGSARGGASSSSDDVDARAEEEDEGALLLTRLRRRTPRAAAATTASTAGGGGGFLV